MSDTPDITTEEILTPQGIEDAIAVLAAEIVSRCGDQPLAFVGVYTRGVTLARRVADVLAAKGKNCSVGTLDISLYRDDFDNHGRDLPKLNSSNVPFELEDTRVILFDEVIFTGRTVRAALDALADYGRPSNIELAVLIDRGHREIPVQPDYTGRKLETELCQYVKVRFKEDDKKEGVFLVTKK